MSQQISIQVGRDISVNGINLETVIFFTLENMHFLYRRSFLVYKMFVEKNDLKWWRKHQNMQLRRIFLEMHLTACN